MAHRRQHFSQEYLAALQWAAKTVAEQVQATLEPDQMPPFAWLKLAPAYPAFCDQAFAYRNQVFAYLVDRLDEKGGSTVTDEAKERLLAVAEQNNLVPCRFAVKADGTAVGDGWNLVRLDNGEKVVPVELAGDEPVKRSEWERLEIAVEATAEWLAENRCGEISTQCAIPGADPQLWFHEVSGDDAWVLVREEGAEPFQEEKFLKEHPTLKDYAGYECRVKLSPEEGETALYRGHQANVHTEGPVKVHLSSSDTGLLAEEQAVPLGGKPASLPPPQEEKEVSGKGCLLYLIAGVAAVAGAVAGIGILG